ncbi:MAG: RAMP superfamily CRISPR-associated protein [Proteobacteria bacterium]|nr:RAMP superfamily CRISPR-associated protein [Pseudomonadota bacterium]
MSRRRIDVIYALETAGPLHIGTGHGARGLSRAILRDGRGLPFIPGSTIKGRARYAATRVCRWMGLDVVTDAVADVSRAGVRTPNGPDGKPDLPARLFGSAWRRCTLRFSNALLRDADVSESEVRTSVARSRLLGTASHQRLFQSEFAPPGLVFAGSVAGYLDCDLEVLGDSPVEPLVLWLALRLMVTDGIGGNKSAGCGTLTPGSSQSIRMTVDGQPFEPSGDDSVATLQLLRDLEPST